MTTVTWHWEWVINAHASIAVCRPHFSSLALQRKHFQISRENHEVPLVTPRFKAELKAAMFYLWSAEWLKVHSTLLQHQIGTKYFYCTTYWTKRSPGNIRFVLHRHSRWQDTSAIGHICFFSYKWQTSKGRTDLWLFLPCSQWSMHLKHKSFEGWRRENKMSALENGFLP